MPPKPRLVAAFLFGSGLTALIYQTVWQRMFRLVFGSSTAASAAVLGIFLGGLGLGGWWFGSRAERHERPLAFYGNLEAGVALSAALTPFLLDLLSHGYFALGGSTSLGTAGATVLRMLIAVLVMGPSVALMGGTLPAAARAIEHDGDASRGRLALLYATNTLGAVLGTLLSTFYLFELFGTRLTLWTAVLINLLIAVFARGAGRDAPPLPIGADSENAAAGGDAELRPAAPPVFVYAALGIVGFAFVCLELIWYRMLAPIMGGSAYTFGIVLAVALAGIGVGGYVYSRRDPELPATPRLLAMTLVLEALAIGIPFALGDTLALYAAYLRPSAAIGFGALVVSWILIAGVIVFPASCVAGYQFPVLFALLGRGRARVARHVGVAYAFNTFGSIAGALAGGFLLLPGVGALGTWRGLIAVLTVLGAVALAVEIRRPSKIAGLVAPLLVGALALCCLRAEGPGAVWRRGAIGAGRFKVTDLTTNQLTASQIERTKELLWERDGIESTIGLTGGTDLAFWVNGKVDGAVLTDRGTQAMLGLTPVALHPDPKSVFVLGLGTGMSVGWVAAVPGIERVDVAELEPAVLDVARAAHQANLDALDQPNVHVFQGDGREFLLTTNRRYDVIVSEPSNPYRAGVASLFTQELYSAAAARLSENGLFGQWLQGYEIDVATLRTVLRTMHTVFPSVEIWQTQSDDLLLIASRAPRSYAIGKLRERLAREPYASALQRMWLVEGAEGFLSHFVANDRLSAKLGEVLSPPLNTDDSTVLEYAFARQVGMTGSSMTEMLFNTSARSGDDHPDVEGAVDWNLVHELRGRSWLIQFASVPRLPGLDQAGAKRLRALELGCRERSYAQSLAVWGVNQPDRPAPRDALETYMLANAYALQGDPLALQLAGELEQRGFRAEAHLVRGRSNLKANIAETAFAELAAGLEDLRRGPMPLCDTTADLLSQLRLLSQNPSFAPRVLAALQRGPLASYLREVDRRGISQEIAFTLPDPQLCVDALGPELQLPRWQSSFLTARAACLKRANHPLAARAEDDLAAFLMNTTGNPEDGLPDDTDTARAER
jgi:spermidine synthase